MSEMSREDRSERILELRIKNERKNVVKKLSPVFPNLSLDVFLGIEETREIKKLIYRYMDEKSSEQEEILKGIEVSVYKIFSVKPLFYNYLDQTAYLFYDGDRETGGIRIRLNDVYQNIEFIMNFTSFSQDFSDLLIVDAQFNFGLCIERQEYNNIFVYWAK